MSDDYELSRRTLLMASGGLGGLLVATSTAVNAAGQQKRDASLPSAAEVAKKIKIDPANETNLAPLFEPDGSSRAVLERLAPGAAPAGAAIDLSVKELADGSTRLLGYALSATITSRGVFPLNLNGQPFIVTRFSCSFDRIAWTAGVGWPVYTTRCPRNNFGSGMFFRDAFAHQIVPWVKGVAYGIGCNNPAAYDFGRPGQLYVGVNDDQYSDNQGTFDFTIYNYS